MDAIIKNIKKTGYVLEYDVSTLLRENGWSVINNKYYIDDVQPLVREIDIVGYKVWSYSDIAFYTVLIISCKKSEKNNWALISKEKNEKDPNINWYPLHIWTNNKALDYIINKPSFEEEYFKNVVEEGILIPIFEPKNHIYAFQEMDKNSGTVRNDKNIYNSITSLMKAQGYEISSLDKRKREPCFYHFSLLSIVDTDLIEVYLDKHGIHCGNTVEEKYISNYIINNQETSAKIHFISSSSFPTYLTHYNHLADFNKKFFCESYDLFFADILTDFNRRGVLSEDFSEYVLPTINSLLRLSDFSDSNLKTVFIYWNNVDSRVSIDLEVGEPVNEWLNSDKRVKRIVREGLHKIFHYRGDFSFALFEIPF